MAEANGRRRPQVGLIVNPVAGLGGRVGLKGSDGEATQRRARALGAMPRALDRAAEALMRLRPIADRFDLVTCAGDMGEEAAARCRLPSFLISTIGDVAHRPTTRDDTVTAAEEMVHLGVDLLLFAGGDGTAFERGDGPLFAPVQPRGRPTAGSGVAAPLGAVGVNEVHHMGGPYDGQNVRQHRRRIAHHHVERVAGVLGKDHLPQAGAGEVAVRHSPAGQER